MAIVASPHQLAWTERSIASVPELVKGSLKVAANCAASMNRDNFLDRLTGRWELRGNMGPTPLHQAVNCRWALGGQFVEMRFRELRGEPYEAAYFVGRDDLTATYVLILADSTGVYPDPTAVVGIGKREGYSVNFKFGVSPHIFTNRFEWHEADGAWSHTLNSIGSDGRVHRFADKRLTRAPRAQR